MKARRDFVTNSSSSSFIINKDDISYDKLLEILLEIANEEETWLDDGESYTDYSEIAYRYRIKEGTPERPYKDYEWDYTSIYYDNHFIIDNDDCGRYDWNAVENVLEKHNIPFVYGYCD